MLNQCNIDKNYDKIINRNELSVEMADFQDDILLNENSDKFNELNLSQDVSLKNNLENLQKCDNNLCTSIQNNYIIKRKTSSKYIITEELKDDAVINTKETIIEERSVFGNNLICNENLYLHCDKSLRTEKNSAIESNEIPKILANGIIKCENLTENDENQTLVKSEEFNRRLIESSKQNRMRLVIGLLLRILLPFASGVASSFKIFRTDKIWRMLRNLGTNKARITNLLAYAANSISLGLSSVQVVHRIDPIIKIIKLKKAQIFERKYSINRPLTSSPTTYSTNQISWETQQIIFKPLRQLSTPRIATPELIQTAEECVSVNVIHEPPEGERIRADIIFIHGLHGSLPNTWKQGLWSNDRMPVDFERPPKPPLRPPKRPKHSRSNIFIPPHSYKKPKWENHLSEAKINRKKENFDFDIVDDDDDNENVIYFNAPTTNSNTADTESFTDAMNQNINSFSTFRLRLNDYNNPSPRPRSATNRPKNADPTAEDVFPFEQPYSRCWPGDWLPKDCPGVRVIAVNYTTDPHLWRPIWIKKHSRPSMSERVRVMTEHLIKLKVGHNRPIVWVGHSKGGLFIKQILVEAWESGKLAAVPLWQNARGVLFYSVPHRGSMLADINLPLVRRSIELIEIEKNSKVLLDLHRRFVNLYYSGFLKIDVFSFVETAMTFMQVLYLRIVGVDSADPGIGDVCGLQLDHREICKPRSRKCMLYTELVKMIKKVY